MGEVKKSCFRTPLGGIVWTSEKIWHAKFEANQIIFRGGASDLKFAQVNVFAVEVSMHSA